jgi:hypothetical protein
MSVGNFCTEIRRGQQVSGLIDEAFEPKNDILVPLVCVAFLFNVLPVTRWPKSELLVFPESNLWLFRLSYSNRRSHFILNSSSSAIDAQFCKIVSICRQSDHNGDHLLEMI